MPTYTQIASLFRQARLDKNLSQIQLAALAGVSQKTVSRYESGRLKRADWQNTQAIATALNVEL